jgi:hypothetical protein
MVHFPAMQVKFEAGGGGAGTATAMSTVPAACAVTTRSAASKGFIVNRPI